MTSVPRPSFFRLLADLIDRDSSAAIDFLKKIADFLDEPDTSIDYLGAEEELEALLASDNDDHLFPEGTDR